jgi:tetratricopeptide (TPR) repeat protein
MAKRWQNKKKQDRAPVDLSLKSFPFLLELASTWQAWLPKVLLIIGSTLWIYRPALHGKLIWDDQWYVLMNPELHNLAGLWKIWYRPGNWVEYYPLHETVLWLQWQLWGDHTLGYHLTNLFLHILNALLVWRLLAKLDVRLAWLGGLIFAVHPVQVESVAYIVELKNTLSMPFFLLSMCAWIDYDESHSKNDYQNALAFFFVGMLCKITMAPFAAIILLYAWWKRGRIGWSDLRACAPFLLVAMILCFATLWAGREYVNRNHMLIGEIPLHGILSRIDAAGLTGTFYFARCFLPLDIVYIYPQWPLHPHSPVEYLPWLVFAAVAGLLWRKRQGWGRHALLGLGFFLILIFPLLGFQPITYMDFTWVMDHLLYLPIIGLIGLFVAGLGDLETKLPVSFRPVLVGLISCLFAGMVWISHLFAGLFVNEETLWTYVLQRNPTDWFARGNLGSNLMEQERYQEATVQERYAIALRPTEWDNYYNLGFALNKLGRPAEAEAALEQALSLNPGNPVVYYDLANLQRRMGRTADAEAVLRRGLQAAPEAENLGAALAEILQQSNRLTEAIEVYKHTVEYNPDVAQLQYNLGAALLKTQNFSEAAEHLDAAVTLNPKLAAAHENLGVALAQLGRLPEAMDQFNAALQINPNLVVAHEDLALALVQTGRIPEAIEQFKKVLEIDPGDAKARDSLTKLQQYEMQQNTPGSH